MLPTLIDWFAALMKNSCDPGYLPGFTENFVSNEVIAAGLSAAQVWPLLSQAQRWPSYYANSETLNFMITSGRIWKTEYLSTLKRSAFRSRLYAMSTCRQPQPPQDELRGMDGRVRVTLGWMFTMPG